MSAYYFSNSFCIIMYKYNMQMHMQSLYMHCYCLLSLAPDNIRLKVSAVTTTSITVIPSGLSGEVSYEEIGSSDGPTNVLYSSSITITNLKPNTWYTITYTVQNSYGTKMTNVMRLTLTESEQIFNLYMKCLTLYLLFMYKSLCLS